MTPFLVVNIAGTIVRVALVRMLGDVFADPILAFAGWIGENRLWLTAVTFAIVTISVVPRSGAVRNIIETPSELADELEEVALEEVADPTDGSDDPDGPDES